MKPKCLSLSTEYTILSVIMKIPITRLKKVIKSSPQWSMAWILTLCLYFVFIFVVLIVAFPLRSQKIVHDVPSNKIDELDVNENNDLTDDEQKLVQRANEAPTVTNQSDVLREAFYE